MELVSAAAVVKGVLTVAAGVVVGHCAIKFVEGVSNACGSENILDAIPRNAGYNLTSFFMTKTEKEATTDPANQTA